jgi:hypothetical protein
LIDLLFQVNNNDFGVDFTSKPYPKYQYQPATKGLKPTEKQAFLKSINGSISDHLYDLHLFKKTNYYFF